MPDLSTLFASVGHGGLNHSNDVTAVQTLLNARSVKPFVPLKVDGKCGPKTQFAIRQYQQRVMGVHAPDGLIAPDGMTIRSLTKAAPSVAKTAPGNGAASAPAVKPATAPASTTPASSVGGHKYTSDPNEQVTRTTPPPLRDLIAVLRSSWPQLTEAGARTLAAQSLLETGHGKFCFNWNLGNVKSPKTDVPHMYLKRTWEVLSASKASAAVQKSPELSHLASADEIKKHGWKGDGTVVVFEPPHPQCRFRAYGSLEEGAKKWIEHHQNVAKKNPSYLAILNSGKAGDAARALKAAHYYTGSESVYINAMTKNKAEIDRIMGAA